MYKNRLNHSHRYIAVYLFIDVAFHKQQSSRAKEKLVLLVLCQLLLLRTKKLNHYMTNPRLVISSQELLLNINLTLLSARTNLSYGMHKVRRPNYFFWQIVQTFG